MPPFVRPTRRTVPFRQRFAADEDLQEIADALDRTLAAVRTKVRDLGLRRNSSRPWPGMDDAYLAEHYGREATSTIAATLGRSCGAVYARAGLLGLSEPNAPTYTDWEITQIRAGYAQGVPVAEVRVRAPRLEALYLDAIRPREVADRGASEPRRAGAGR